MVGKSTIVEIIAMKYGRSVYSIILNNNNMTDANLINLINQIPPNSLIVFDEFEKQYEAFTNNPNVKISNGGILSAIDGLPRLSHGSIVLMIVNERSILPKKLIDPLLRIGRLDKSFVFD